MAKRSLTLAPDISPDRPRRSRVLPILSLVVATPLLLPIVVDATTLCYAQWCEMLGAPIAVSTPTLDAIGERLAEAREHAWYHISSRFHRVPWDPRVVMIVAVLVMILGMAMIRF